jgi:bis(5'-nucleosyl)-tetraphosphatase (symmetrical)
MTIYAIGDVQGCFEALQALLEKIHYQSTDILWFTGDLVNRGPHSLAVLRFITSLKDKQVTVLGNHDLHLIAVAMGAQTIKRNDTFEDVLHAPDRDELIAWLRRCPLLHHDKKLGYIMTHAGIPPMWNAQEAALFSQEVERVLQSDQAADFLQHMYGKHPEKWETSLIGHDRLRCITNYFTRMRLCDEEGRLDFDYKGEMKNKPANLFPWFEVPHRKEIQDKIIFGHWAALQGRIHNKNIFPLDTGCVWGGCLTALRLEDGKRFVVECDKF